METLVLFIPVAVGIGVGIATGRWWSLIVAGAVGGWIAYSVPLENTERPFWEFGIFIAGLIALGTWAGISIRRKLSGVSEANDQPRKGSRFFP